MVSVRYLTLNNLLAVICIVLAILLIRDIYWYHIKSQENNFIIDLLDKQTELPIEFSAIESPQKRFAYAVRLADEKKYDESAEQYSLASRNTNDALKAKIFYNLGNLYLKQAIQQAENRGVDSAMAFTDAAKGYYRRSLKITPDYLDAKFNYETAQRLVRDLPLNSSSGGEGADDDAEDLWSAMPGFPAGLP